MHTYRVFPTQDLYRVLCEVWSDTPGLIDTAWVNYRDWPSSAMYLSTGNVWSAFLNASYFNDPHLGSVIGHPFTLHIKAVNDSHYSSEPVYLFRVIEDTPALNSPHNGQIVGPYPRLIWVPFRAGYPFSYLISIYVRVETIEALVWSANSVSADSAISVPDSLENGSYYWTLHVVDEFENTSRSQQGFFIVAAEGQP